MTLPARHTETFPIRAFECDLHGRLLPRTFCLLLQEAASAHAAELGVSVDTLIARGVAWVLSQLRIDVQRWPTGGERLTIETWPEAASGTRTERRFAVRTADGQRVGEAVTIWLVLDLNRRRPVRLPDFVRDALAEVVASDEPATLDPIPAFASPRHTRSLTDGGSGQCSIRHAARNNSASLTVATPSWAIVAVSALRSSSLATAGRRSSVSNAASISDTQLWGGL